MDSSPTAPTTSKQAWNSVDPSFEIDSAAKYRAYQRDYLRWIHHKYFSQEMLGVPDPVYECITTIEDCVIKAAKNPPLKPFSEPNASLESLPGSEAHPSNARKKQKK